MMDDSENQDFDDAIGLVLARSTAIGNTAPGADVRARLMARLARSSVPDGFSLKMADDAEWLRHPVPGIRMKVLSINRSSGYATLELDVRPGTRFPAHHHSGAEECYVLSGSLHTCGRRLGPGDFVHADAGTDHPELWTEEGCRVLLIVAPDEHLGRLAP
jgi:anti-sigma factor ChrR (cupin superfamily)